MNRIYRLIWSKALKCIVAVAENTKGRGKDNTKYTRGWVAPIPPKGGLSNRPLNENIFFNKLPYLG
jgi:hypothetical protein